ncbi:MAG: LacI family transcriptional regulator [Firmicutes bacterium]|jgi:LacI family transcriptional regulator|uniref:LacI family transcriptional regulator n=1 Tax=Sulfobacillus benefaciens TaxID=453960 RepID=A0A2T2X584_9FIRM|nr:LacI family transcriptional regulator [Bacillota bacterium]MCL5012919.1 LacI family transcriptional regulator [Bacillota bacterium]PSR29671.1 MAG: LacI family transcriptional regulator [Sulfobacillus benefaciens]
MATIRDVANLARVSVSTVSLVLRQPHRVSPETRERVEKAVEELQYQLNGIARDLRVRKTDTIAILLHNLSGPFYSELIRGVEEAGDALGFTTLAAGCSKNHDQGSLRLLKEGRVDGAIVLDPTISSPVLLRYARKTLPIVVLDRGLSGELQSDFITAVGSDHESGGYLAGQHLLAQGYRRFALIAGPVNSEHSHLREMGFFRALQEGAVDVTTIPVIHSDFTEQGGIRAMNMLLDHEWTAEAVFSANDEMAIGALQVLEERHFAIPKDVAVMGFDDIRLARYVTPPLSTIRQPMYELGVAAMKQLHRAMEGKTRIPGEMLPVKLVPRASTQSRITKAGDESDVS